MKLRHYFQAHDILVPSSHPLKDVLRKREASGRIGKWATEHSQFNIDFVHRSSIKSQALADFIADWTPVKEDVTVPVDTDLWKVHCDGSWTAQGAGAAAIVHSPSGITLSFAIRLEFPAQLTMLQSKKQYYWASES